MSDPVLKILIIGPSNVGKSARMSRAHAHTRTPPAHCTANMHSPETVL